MLPSRVIRTGRAVVNSEKFNESVAAGSTGSDDGGGRRGRVLTRSLVRLLTFRDQCRRERLEHNEWPRRTASRRKK